MMNWHLELFQNHLRLFARLIGPKHTEYSGSYVSAQVSLNLGKVCCQLTGSSDFTLKSLLPVNWQQRFYDEMAAAS